jgi:hypothetical protein
LPLWSQIRGGALIYRVGLRTVAFAAVALAAIVGLATRIVIANSGGPPVQFAGTKSLDLRVGQSFGDATFDGVDENDALRLRLKQCNDYVFAVPILLTNIAIPELADRDYGRRPHYTHVEVYNGQLRREFSRLPKLIAHGILKRYNIDKGFFVQFYAPTDCDIPDGSYVRWANLILKPDSEPVEGAE